MICQRNRKGIAFLVVSIIFVMTMILNGCGGGGSGGSSSTGQTTSTAEQKTSDTGVLEGYVYIPVGSAPRNSATRVSALPGMPQEVTVPAGYMPLADASISIVGSALGTSTDSSGYFIIPSVPAGAHTLTIIKSGFDTITQSVNVTTGKVTPLSSESVEGLIMKPPNSGILHVTSTPAGALISIDSVSTGLVTPQTLEWVSPGIHSLSVALNGFKTSVTKYVDVKQSEEALMWFTLDPEGGGKMCADSSIAEDGICQDVIVYIETCADSPPDASNLAHYYECAYGIKVDEIMNCLPNNITYSVTSDYCPYWITAVRVSSDDAFFLIYDETYKLPAKDDVLANPYPYSREESLCAGIVYDEILMLDPEDFFSD